MSRLLVVFVAVSVALIVLGNRAGQEGPAEDAAEAAYAQLPVGFELNQGQTDPAVRYLTRSSGYTTFLTDSEAVVVPRADGDAAAAVVRMRFVGGNPKPAVRGLDAHPGVVNYLRAGDADAWLTGVPTYAGVRYDEIYPGVDAVFRGDANGEVAYDFIVAAGADPSQIELAFDGIEERTVDKDGDLVLSTSGGEVRHSKPVVFQEVEGDRQPVAGAFVLDTDGGVRFALGDYDPARPLVIDPVLTYSTYIGGLLGADTGNAIAVDATGAAYVAGSSASQEFPTTAGAYQTVKPGGTDGFVAKLNPEGSDLVYSTYIGGADVDVASALAIDDTGAAYVAGETRSADFPVTEGAPQASHSTGLCATTTQPDRLCRDAFVLKLTPDGAALAYSTYLGGDGEDVAAGITVEDGSAYVTGTAAAPNFPTTEGAFQRVSPGTGAGQEAFVTKLAPDGQALEYSTFIGGLGDDVGEDVVVDSDGAAYVTGATPSVDFPTTAGSLQPDWPSAPAAFVTKLTPDGSDLAYSTYLGGGESTFPDGPTSSGQGIALDDDNFAYIVGHTTADDFPTQNPLQAARAGEEDLFVSKLAPDGASLAYSTFLGGPSLDIARDITVGPQGAAYVVGDGVTGGMPLVDPVDYFSGNNGVTAAKLTPDGSALEYSTYLSGTSSDQARAVAVHPTTGAMFVTGIAAQFSAANDFPTTPGAFQTERRGSGIFSGEVFVSRIDPVDPDLPLVTRLEPRSGPAAGSTAVRITGRGFTPGTTVQFGDQPADVRFQSSTSLVALSPPGALGIVNVTVTTPAGTSPANPSNEFEYAEGAWRSSDMSQARNMASQTLLEDGRVLVAGGRSSYAGPALGSAEIYDPATNTWAATGSMATARFYHTATLLEDGRVLVAGGFAIGPPTGGMPVNDSAEIFDPATGQWSAAGTLAVRRAAHGAALLGDGRVLVAGGRTCALPPPEVCGAAVRTATAELYDPATNAWTPAVPLNHARNHFPTVVLHDGRPMVIGGFGTNSNAEIYDPAANTWTVTGDLAFSRSRGAAEVLDDGRVFLAGGFRDYHAAEIYDPATNVWTGTTPSEVGRHNHASAKLPSGDVLIAGGGHGGDRPEVFSPDTQTWSSAGRTMTVLGTSNGVGGTYEGVELDDGSVLFVGTADFPTAERYVQFPEAQQLPPDTTSPSWPGDAQLSVSDITETSVTLSWPAASDDTAVTGYHLYRNGTLIADIEGMPLPTSHTVTGLSPGTSYTFTVEAHDAGGNESEDGPSATVTTLDEPTVDPGLACDPDLVPESPFTDIAGNVHEANIECILWYGVTQGTTPTTYSPAIPVNRDQMASFIARLMETAGVALPAASDQGFTDIAGNVHADRINQLAAVGVVQGKNATTYAPREEVRRDQMASFLVRAYEVINGEELARQAAPFTDIAGNTHQVNIEKAATAGFAQGRTATTYEPALSVRRDQMGSFLARVLNRAMVDGHVTHPGG